MAPPLKGSRSSKSLNFIEIQGFYFSEKNNIEINVALENCKWDQIKIFATVVFNIPNEQILVLVNQNSIYA